VKVEPNNVLEGTEGVFQTLKEIEDVALKSETVLRAEVRPIRKLLIKRFPVMFLLLVTVGFVSVSFGIEEIMHRYHFFSNHPFLVLAFGLLLLIVTGAAYKRDIS
jgi:predicted tellurium resistance membrane protein TerC